jgi:hypothetical protein
VVGARVSVNQTCLVVDEKQRWRNSEQYLVRLGTYDSSWVPKERSISVSAGQYVTLQYAQTVGKIPGLSLKVKILSCPRHSLLSVLDYPWGLQVSFCTGVSRRVLLREIMADLLPDFIENRIWVPEMWEELKSTHKIVGKLQNKDDSVKDWVKSLPANIRDYLNEIVLDLLKEMEHTGIDREGKLFKVAWIQKDQDFQCFQVPWEKESYWARMLADSSDCATFAYVTSRCLESDRHKCRGPTAVWCQATAILETAVSCYQPNTRGSQPLALKHSESYSIGRCQSLVAKVNRLNNTDPPQLHISWVKSQIPLAFRIRLESKKGLPQLREKQYEDSCAEMVLILAAASGR